MNTPITFEIAKLLKEKEYDKVCYRAFLFKIYQPSNIYEENIEQIKNAENFSDSHYEKYYKPTIAEVLMWLYEKHGIWIIAVPTSGEKGKWHYHRFDLKNSNNDSEPELVPRFSTPTEAYLSAIKYTLKQII